MLQITFPTWDRDLFLYLNSKHNPWFDPIMYAVSTYTAWMLICVSIIVFMIYRDRIWGKRAAVFMLMGVAMNSITNNIIKILIMRPRPSNEPDLQDIIHQLGDPDNHYSFFSAHSSNSICLALFSTLYFRNKYYGIVIFAWAMTVAYSRIYVGRHYPLDIICGILFGLLTGWISDWLYQMYRNKKTSQTIN